jgi:hypothetical protein
MLTAFLLGGTFDYTQEPPSGKEKERSGGLNCLRLYTKTLIVYICASPPRAAGPDQV